MGVGEGRWEGLRGASVGIHRQSTVVTTGPSVSRKTAGACGEPTNLADTVAVTEMLGVTLAVSDTVGDADALAEVEELDTTHVEKRTPGPTKGNTAQEPQAPAAHASTNSNPSMDHKQQRVSTLLHPRPHKNREPLPPPQQ